MLARCLLVVVRDGTVALGRMATLLIIAAGDALRSRWRAAAVDAGNHVCAVTALRRGIEILRGATIDGVLVDARGHDGLALLAAASAHRPLPPLVIVHDRAVALPARAHAAACRTSAASPAHLVELLGCMVGQRGQSLPTNLPMLVTSAALKWTSRLTAMFDDRIIELADAFDGDTDPAGLASTSAAFVA